VSVLALLDERRTDGTRGAWIREITARCPATPPNSTPGRYRPPDTTLAFLEAL